MIRTEQLQPELFKPMLSCEVARYLKVSNRTLEDWRRKSRETEELIGPPFVQDFEGGKVLYPTIGVQLYAMARAVGKAPQEATQFALYKVLDHCNESGLLGCSLHTFQPETHRSSRLGREDPSPRPAQRALRPALAARA